MDNMYRFDQKEGYENVITSDNSNLEYLGFDSLFLAPGNKLEHEIEGEEIAIVLQSGDFKASVECENGEGLEEIKGIRQSVFDQLPTVIYLPPGSKIEMETKQGMEALVFSAECEEEGSPCFITPEDINEVNSGTLNWRRRVRVILGPESDITNKLIVGESVSTPGGWIGFPAHKHDTECETEYPLEEIFSFKLDGPHGAFALHHTYDYENDHDEHYLIDDDNIAVAIAGGYHTSQAVPGCRYYLLWGLAGECKEYKLTTDPRFQWLEDAEALFEESVGRNLGDVMWGNVE
jgi:5-deoxy-glucuronate isomerase